MKVSEEEMELLTGEVQLAAGADALASRGLSLLHIYVIVAQFKDVVDFLQKYAHAFRHGRRRNETESKK